MKERIRLGRTGTEEEVGWDNEGGRRTGKGKDKMNCGKNEGGKYEGR